MTAWTPHLTSKPNKDDKKCSILATKARAGTALGQMKALLFEDNTFLMFRPLTRSMTADLLFCSSDGVGGSVVVWDSAVVRVLDPDVGTAEIYYTLDMSMQKGT